MGEFVNNTLNGFTYPTFEPTTAPTNLHNSTCYMFGLLCEEDFTKLGWTGAPSSAPTSFPTYIDEDSGNNVTMPHTECYMFGLICPTVTSAPTQAPTAKPALRMIDLSEKKKVETQRIEEKVESEANDALEIPKKITRKAKKLSSEDTFRDQEMSAYFEDEEDNFDSSKKTSSKNKKVTKMYNSGSSRSKKNGKLSLKSRN